MLAELVVNPVHLAYGVMVVGIVFTFIFSRRKKGDLRTVTAGFVIPFVQLSNYICPRVPKSHLQVKELEDGKVQALPKEQQPGEIRAMLQRANEDTSVKLFAKLAEEAAKVQDKAGIDRKEKAHFAEPVDDIYEQPKHRYMLMKRLPGSMNDKYSQLNTEYGDEMEELEKAEFEAMKNGKRR